MCKWGNYRILLVKIPAELSYTGEDRWDLKPIDSCIADVVDALNAAGIYTTSCCCGHGDNNGRIDLEVGFMHSRIDLGMDGNQYTAKFEDFINLQESVCGFGSTQELAVMDLLYHDSISRN